MEGLVNEMQVCLEQEETIKIIFATPSVKQWRKKDSKNSNSQLKDCDWHLYLFPSLSNFQTWPNISHLGANIHVPGHIDLQNQTLGGEESKILWFYKSSPDDLKCLISRNQCLWSTELCCPWLLAGHSTWEWGQIQPVCFLYLNSYVI